MRLASQLFRTASLVALAGWSVLIFLPGWSLAEEAALGVGVVWLAVIYLVLLAMGFSPFRVCWRCWPIRWPPLPPGCIYLRLT